MFHVKQSSDIKDTEVEVVLETKDYMVSGESFSIVKRPGQSYLETQPVPLALDRYYESDAYVSHTDASDSFFERTYQFIKQITLRQKVRSIGKPKSKRNMLLDFGAGTGDFLQTAKSKSWKVYGVEPNFQARELARKKRLELFSSLEGVKGKQFDVITLWHVLEHVPNLTECLKKLDALLSPGGILVIAVPNYKSWDAKKYKEFWAAYDVPRHLWHFDRKAMKELLPKTFRQIRTKPMWFDAFYVSLLSEKYRTGKQNWIKGGLNGLRSNLSACYTKEYSSIVYYYQKGSLEGTKGR